MQLERLAAALADRYHVERELGAGGMATVYLARDLRHERPVALKVLHPELGAVLGGDRFLAEIKTTAVLQHPNILQLFDSGIADGLLYYVMPFVEGETLRGRLAREKQLPVDEAVTIARGVAAALDYAHRHGVIHRDIKPENILLQDGQPLVADFGIALAVKAAGGVRLTQTGLSLGTPQYMSPEQATGERELDARSDVYALAAVTYEMLAGEPPFSGSTTQAIIAKLMTEEPRAVSVLRRAVPAQVEAAVHRALEKLPADRFATAAQFGEALMSDAKTQSRKVGTSARHTPSVFPSFRLSVLLAILAFAGLAAGFVLGRGRETKSSSSPPSQLAIVTPGFGIGMAGISRQVSIAPDGETVAYFASGTTGGGQVMLRRLDAAAPVRLQGADFVFDVQFAPDGRSLYFDGASGNMERMPLSGGARTPLPGVTASSFMAWQSDGTLWFNGAGLGLLRVPAGGGTPQERFRRDAQGRTLIIQQVLPGDREAVVVRYPSTGTAGEAMILGLADGKTTPLLEQRVVAVRYSAGSLVYVLPDATMDAVGFDPKSHRLIGEPVHLAADVSLSGTGIAQFAASANGTVVYIPAQARALVLVDRSGAARPLTDQQRNFHNPHFSPDGRRIAVDFPSQDGRDVWILDRDQGGLLTRVTFDKDGHDPFWSADGKSIAYTSQKSGDGGTWRTRPGVGGSDSIFASSKLAYTGIWLPDGKTMVTAATDLHPGSGGDIAFLRPGAPQPLEPIAATPFTEGWPAVSPDGKLLAFASDQSGRLEVYVRPLSGTGSQVQVSLDGGNEPVWGPNGKELFYRRAAGMQVDLVAATVQTAPEFRVLERKTLFPATEFDPAQPHSNYDISPDGKSFAMVRRNPSSHLVVIQNLPELMRRSARREVR